jgi:LysM repeat protein
MEPSENGASSPTQRLLIGIGTLIVVILTLMGAIFLAMQDSPAEPTAGATQPVAQISPTAVAVVTNTPSATPSATPLPTDTPTATPLPPTDTDTPTPLPPPTDTPTIIADTPPPPPPATDTPVAAPPPEEPSATPLPPPPTQPVGTVAACQPPPGWITYQVQVGDTLNELAARTNTTVNELVQVNCLQSFTVRPGDIIALPFEPPVPTATVTPGPTGTRGPTPTRTATPIGPRINSATVNIDLPNNLITVIVTGENFRSQEAGFRAELRGFSTIPLQLGEARTSTSFEATAPLDELGLGEYDLVVINANGRLDVRENVWPTSSSTATPTPAPPIISRVSPSSGQITSQIRLTVQGSSFRPLETGFRVELQLDDGSLNVEVFVDETVRPATSTSFDVLIEANTLISGDYDMLVTNPDGRTDIERLAYRAIP